MTQIWMRKKLGEILVEKGYVNLSAIKVALQSEIKPIGQALVVSGRINEEQLSEAIAIQANIQYRNLRGFFGDKKLFQFLSPEKCNQLKVLPLYQEANCLYVATSDPFNLVLSERLEKLCTIRIKYVSASLEGICAALERISGSHGDLKEASDKLKLRKEGGEDSSNIKVLDENSRESADPVIGLVNKLLLTAIKKRASDIHIEAHDDGVSVRYRIDGVLLPALETIDLAHHSFLVSRLKVMADLDITERRVPQDGRFNLRVQGRDIDFRISVLPSSFGEDVVVRVLDRISLSDEMQALSLDGLGLDQNTLLRLRKSIEAPYGMILVSGPTGSGKTTTLYAALNELNLEERKVITVEDPVEYQLKGIVQVPVNEKKGFYFSDGLRSILRHDPDIVMVGEIRDQETAQIAVQAALTGHLLFSTVHANSAIDVIPRFHHMGIDVYDFVSVLQAVFAQRLIRKICSKCKCNMDKNDLGKFLSNEEIKKHSSHIWVQGEGCEFCNESGYIGRTVISEVMLMTPRLRDLVVNHASMQKIYEAAIDEGMETLREVAISKALAGETSLIEVNRVTCVG